MKTHDWFQNDRKIGTVFYNRKGKPRYIASIDGPWYDDSNPEGYGDTEEEAKKNAFLTFDKFRTEVEQIWKALQLLEGDREESNERLREHDLGESLGAT